MKVEIIEQNSKLFLKYLFNGRYELKDTELEINQENITFLQKKVIPQFIERKTKQEREYFYFYAQRYINQKSHIKTTRELKLRVEYLLNTFQNTKLSSMIVSDIEDYFLSMLQDKTPRTIKKYLGDFRAIIRIAIKDGVIKSDPSKDLELPKHQKKEIEIFTVSEVNLILKNAKPLWFRNFLALLFRTGMRPGEAIGLKLDDIKFDIIEIRRDIRRGVIQTPKTEDSKRRILIVDELRPYIHSQVELARSVNSEFLFFNPNQDNIYFKDVEYVRGNNKEGRWVRLLNSLNLKYRQIYSTRHTYVTTMIKNAIDLQIIAQNVGHTTIEQIIKTYSKFIQNEHLKINKSLDIYKE